MDQLKSIILIGSGGHAVSVAGVALAAGYKIICFVDRYKKSDKLMGLDVFSNFPTVAEIEKPNIAIAIGHNYMRQKVYEELMSSKLSIKFPPLIHPSAIISEFCEIHEGSVIMPGSIIGIGAKIGRFCLINTAASIDHNSEMSDFSSLGPGVVTGGGVKIGERTAISLRAAIMHGVTIAEDCVVGASSYANKDISKNQIAYGIPARKIRARIPGDNYL